MNRKIQSALVVMFLITSVFAAVPFASLSDADGQSTSGTPHGIILDVNADDLGSLIDPMLKDAVQEALAEIEDDATWTVTNAKFNPDVYAALGMNVIESENEATLSVLAVADALVDFEANGVAESKNKKNFSIDAKLEMEVSADIDLHLIKIDAGWVLDGASGKFGAVLDPSLDIMIPVDKDMDDFEDIFGDLDDLGDFSFDIDDDNIFDLDDIEPVELVVREFNLDGEPLILSGNFSATWLSDDDEPESELVTAISMMNNIASFVKSMDAEMFDDESYVMLSNMPGFLSTVTDDVIDDSEEMFGEILVPSAVTVSDFVNDAFESMYAGLNTPETMMYLAMVQEFVDIKENFVLSSSEYNGIQDRVDSVIKKGSQDFAETKHTVTFVNVNGTVATTQTVEHGKSIKIDDKVSSLMNSNNEGEVFYGWIRADSVATLDPANPVKYVAGSEFVSLDCVIGDVTVMPVYGIEIENFDKMSSASYSDISVLITDLIKGETEFSIENVKDAKNLKFFVEFEKDDDVPVNKLGWQFSGSAGSTVSTVNTNVNVEMIGSSDEKGIKINFEHSGLLPTGTSVVLQLDKEKYAAGTAFDLYHIEPNGDKKLVAAGVMVDKDGDIEFQISECSSYVLEKNSTVSGYAALSSGSSDGSNTMFYIGFGVGFAVVVIAAAAFFFIRRN
ncbi:MAG: hypothetical protein IJF47_04910 [Candidatus Methanomethylophilaceae archaeon]|nr:hypothetical protein [Candidatus Methanomethylophilaceae archaeon]